MLGNSKGVHNVNTLEKFVFGNVNFAKNGLFLLTLWIGKVGVRPQKNNKKHPPANCKVELFAGCYLEVCARYCLVGFPAD